MYSQSSQLQGGFAQSMALWKHPHPHAVSHPHAVGFSLKKNTKSTDLQNATYLFQQLHCRLLARDYMLNVKLDIPSHQKFSSISWNSRKMAQKQKFSSISWNSRNMAQKIGGTSTGLGLSFAVSGMAYAEGPVDNNIDSTQTTESSTISTHGKNVCTDYSVTGIPVDRRCLFRSVAHGACIRSGKPIPND